MTPEQRARVLRPVLRRDFRHVASVEVGLGRLSNRVRRSWWDDGGDVARDDGVPAVGSLRPGARLVEREDRRVLDLAPGRIGPAPGQYRPESGRLGSARLIGLDQIRRCRRGRPGAGALDEVGERDPA